MNKTSPPTIEAQLKSIQQLIQAAKFNDAIKQSEQLLEQATDKQDNIELGYLIAVAQRYAKTFSQALISLNKLLKLDETHSRANQEQGYNYLGLHKPTKAKVSFEKAVALNPSLVASWQELIELYRQTTQPKEVQTASKQVARLK